MRNLVATFVVLFLAACASAPESPDHVVITVIGTNDVHGELVPQPDRGGIATFSGYVANVRAARAADGALLLVDAGDMWQGTLESNLNEGRAVLDAYNALGYAATAIGNHEFDFGPAGPKVIPEDDGDDPRGVLRANAGDAQFPFLAANIIDSETGELVAWDNVLPSTMVQKAGVSIGLIGVTTTETPDTTMAGNLIGLEFAPLAAAIEEQARALRQSGAALVVVLAHAGSGCGEFDDPSDLSTCNMDDEIMRVATTLPPGLVDHIVAGHRHQGIAHEVNGIVVTAAYSNMRAFGRVDFTIDRATGVIVDHRIHPPHPIEPDRTYEGRPVVADPEIAAIVAGAEQVAAEIRAEPLGVTLETAILLRERPEAPLGNLFTDAVLQMNDADISIHNVWGGIRAELDAGEVTYGDVYRVMPFDNRIGIVELSGAELRRVIAAQAHNRNRAAGFSGMRVYVSCGSNGMSLRMVRTDGSEIGDSDTVRVVANDFLLHGGDGILVPASPANGFDFPDTSPLVRDQLADWFRQQEGPLASDDFFDPEMRRWNLPEEIPDSCQLHGA